MNKKDRKIVAFVEDDTADGGLGMAFRSLARFFTASYKVYYFSTRPYSDRIPENIEFVRIYERSRFDASENGLKRSLLGIKPLRSLIKTYKPDVMISFGLYSNIRVCQAALYLPVKVLVSERGNAARFQGGYRLLLSFALGRADKIVFQSEAAKRAYPSNLNGKGVVIPNALFKGDIPNGANSTWDNRIVSVGRIHPDKNFSLLIEAFSKIAADFPQIQLVIYGEEEKGNKGAYLEELKQQAASLKLSDRIIFAGQSSNIGKEILGSRLFVLSSVLEGMPNALIEAMACGIPCITTDFKPGCANEIVDNQNNGIIVPPESPIAMADAMRMLLKNNEFSRYIARNATKIRDRLSTEVILGKWKDEIDGLLCENRNA